MEIRKYEDKDETSVVDLWQELLSDGAPHNDPLTSIKRKVAVDRDLFLVATMNESVIGTAMGGYDGHRGWVYAVAVKQEFQRQGIATALMRQLEKKLKELGCPKINLQIRTSNTEVVAFYRKLGYDVEGRVSMGKRLYDEGEKI